MNNINKLHKVEIEILDEIDLICKKNNIKYFLVGGTLLGAVRHKGFIPWDDDIDIAMLREDYNKFIKICLENNALSSKFFLHCNQTDKNYWLPYIKVRKNNTTFCEKNLLNINTHKGIFVDIFPFDNVKYNCELGLKIRGLIVRTIIQTVFVKNKILKLSECHNKRIVLCLRIFSMNFLIRIRDKLMHKNNSVQTKKMTSFAGVYNIINETLEKDYIFPLKKITFENKKYPCFKNTDYYLSKLYGDYMKLPPKDKRLTHMPEVIDFENGENWVTELKNKE